MNEVNPIFLPFRSKVQRGAVKGKSCIAYSFDLLSLEGEAFSETEQFLTELTEKYLAFLRKESEKECSFVRFAGLSLVRDGLELSLSAALCPFSEREYRPVAKLIFDQECRLSDVKKEKRSRQKP